MLHRIQCVSLPRSGHNLLVSHLQKYFESHHICVAATKKRKSLFGRYQEKIPAPQATPTNFHYCEYYYACRQHPCSHEGNTFQKSHDFDLSLPCEPGQKYLIQFRNPLSLLISWFEMRLLRNRETNSAEGFLTFVDRNEDYIKGFHEKWIQNETNDRLLVDYESYISNPAGTLADVILFFGDEKVVDVQKVNRIVKDVKPAKDDSQFRFYAAVAQRSQLWSSASSSSI